MNCEEFEDRLDEIASGSLWEPERQAAANHVATCERCRRLFAAVNGEWEGPAPQVQDALVRSILSRTTGPACARAQLLLCDWLDGSAEAGAQEMVALHVDHCASCSELAQAVIELGDVLPEMASIDPGPEFTRDVLQATLYAEQCGVRETWPVSEWWIRLIRRTRFAWEAAYVGALLILLIVGNPAVLPKVLTVPQTFIDNSDQVLQQTSTLLSERRNAARKSFSDLESKGKTYLGKAAEFQSKTKTELLEGAFSWFQALKSGLLGEEPPRDLR